MESKKENTERVTDPKVIKEFIGSFIGDKMISYLTAGDVFDARRAMSSILLTEKNGGRFLDAVMQGVQDEHITELELWNDDKKLHFFIRQEIAPYWIEGYMSNTTRDSEVTMTDCE